MSKETFFMYEVFNVPDSTRYMTAQPTNGGTSMLIMAHDNVPSYDKASQTWQCESGTHYVGNVDFASSLTYVGGDSA